MSTKAPKASSTFEKVTELEKASDGSPTAPPTIARAYPGPMRPPPPGRPTVPPPVPTKSTAKNTIALGDADLEPLSALSRHKEFSIRRGAVLAGRFRVTQLIGAGAQCFVYAAEHTTLKHQVAIKCLQPDLVSPELVERFAREAQALTAIRNAHVAAVLDVGRAACGTPFIVMEFLQGRDLSSLLESRPRLEPRHATEIVLQTCEGLAAAHALGLVHQDIKPSNIFLSDEMGLVKAKVVDFGVARVSVDKTPSLRPRFTRSKLDDTVGGTPFYMPPEQFFANSVIDPRSDIFSLGMVLYEMLRGTNAFDLEMSTRRPGEPVRIERSGIDPGLAEVIEKCLAQEPAGRYDTVAELAVALLPYAPSRSRSHAEAAAALLRKAGLSVASTMPSSIPPPMPGKSTLPTLSIPPAAPLPTIVPVKKASRMPLYAGIGVVALAAAGVGAWRLSATSKNAADTGSSQSSPAAASSGAPMPVIGINPAQRGATAATEEPDAKRGAAPSSTSTRGEAPPSSAGKPGLATAGALPKPGPAGAVSVRAGAAAGAASAPASASAAPKPAGTSEDLGF